MKYLTLYKNNKVESIMEIDDDSKVLTSKQFFVKNTFEDCLNEIQTLNLEYLYVEDNKKITISGGNRFIEDLNEIIEE
jgi:hypothetical protein